MKLLGALIASVVGCSSLAQGQGREPVSAGYLHKFDADVDAGGSVSVGRWNLSGGTLLKKNDQFFAALSASYSVDDYKFGAAFNPWGEVRVANIGVPIRWKLNDKWTLATVGRLGSAAEAGANKGGSYNWSVVTSFDYKWSDSLTIGPGFSYVDQLEDSASVFPILSLNWQISDQLKLSTGPSEGANSGANVYLEYSPNDKWTYSSGFFYENSRFRLAENSSSAADGVGEAEYAALYGVVKYQPLPDLSVSLIAGYSFGNEYNLFDSVGKTVTRTESDATPFAGLRVNYEF